jgi:glycosyltransferase involved in cell wall biosynthesis
MPEPAVKILPVVHYFLPRHQAGTEIYTLELARALAQDNIVQIFTSEDGVPKNARFEIKDEFCEGLKVRSLVHPGPRDFHSSYEDPEFDHAFGDMLDEYQPDVVHFQHLYRLSIGFIEEARRRGIPAVLTLADYWFLCPPIIMLRPGFELCPGPERGERCVSCPNAIGKFYAGDVAPFMIGVENLGNRIKAAGHAFKRHLPPSWVSALRKLSGQAKTEAERRELLTTRFEAMRAALDKLDMILAPSQFLRQKMIEGGLVRPDKIIHSDYGFASLPSLPLPREEHGIFRFGFIGTLVEHKGLHVAIQAMNRLADVNAELVIHGDEKIFPGYVRGLRRIAQNPAIRFAGRFEHNRIGEILSGLDALLVPSLWYENSPLTIHEAFLAGVPVITSDLGGMAELVQHGPSGLLFRTGDPEDMARAMKRMIFEPGLREKLKTGIPRVKTIEENVKELTEIYKRIQAGRA